MTEPATPQYVLGLGIGYVATLAAIGCVQHARIGRGIATRLDGGEYLAPPDLFDVLGPTHPEYQRGKR